MSGPPRTQAQQGYRAGNGHAAAGGAGPGAGHAAGHAAASGPAAVGSPPETPARGRKAGFVESPRIRDLSNRIRTYLQAGIPVHLRGPAGCGKTSIAMHVANLLRRPHVMVVGDKNMTTADLVGAKSGYQTKRVVDNFVNSVSRVEENVTQGWQDHRLTIACREGFTFIYDEFNRSPAAANNVLLSVVEERILVMPSHAKHEEFIRVDPRFALILTSNPTEYAGTHDVQDALADRMITIDLDHTDRSTELDITSSRSGASRDMVERIVDFVRDYRDSGAYAQAPTMRASIMLAKIAHAAGGRLSTDNPLVSDALSDVLEAKCGSGGDPKLRAARRDYLSALARHHFDGAHRPVPPFPDADPPILPAAPAASIPAAEALPLPDTAALPPQSVPAAPAPVSAPAAGFPAPEALPSPLPPPPVSAAPSALAPAPIVAAPEPVPPPPPTPAPVPVPEPPPPAPASAVMPAPAPMPGAPPVPEPAPPAVPVPTAAPTAEPAPMGEQS